MNRRTLWYVMPAMLFYCAFMLIPAIKSFVDFFNGGYKELQIIEGFNFLVQNTLMVVGFAFLILVVCSFALLSALLRINSKEGETTRRILRAVPFVSSSAIVFVLLLFLPSFFGTRGIFKNVSSFDLYKVVVENHFLGTILTAAISVLPWIWILSVLYCFIIKEVPMVLLDSLKIDNVGAFRSYYIVSRYYIGSFTSIAIIFAVLCSFKILEPSIIFHILNKIGTENLFTYWLTMFDKGEVTILNNLGVAISVMMLSFLLVIFGFKFIFSTILGKRGAVV